MIDELRQYLQAPVDWTVVNELGHEVFYNGNFDRMEELFYQVLPIINMTYYQHLTQWDDRGYAHEDLLQDAILEIYRDMTLRWDKFIYVEDYYSYFKAMCKNVMLSLVQVHHGYYLNVEYDPDTRNDLCTDTNFASIETGMYKEYLQTSIIELTRKLASKRIGYAKVLDYLITWKIVNKNTDMSSLKSRVNGISWWLTRSNINFLLDHVDYLYRFSYNYYLAKERGEDAMVTRLERIISRFEDSTYSVLSKNYGTTVIPEIYAEFGPALTKKFVKLFGGKQIEVPNYTDFCDDLVGGSLLSLVSSKDDLYKIAEEYNMPYSSLSRIYNRALKTRNLDK